MFFLYIILSYYWNRTGTPFLPSFPKKGLFVLAYNYITGTIGIFTYFLLFKYFFNHKLKLLNLLGKETLCIYAIHFYFINILIYFTKNPIYIFTLGLPTITLCSFYASYLLDKTAITAFIFKGKYK